MGTMADMFGDEEQNIMQGLTQDEVENARRDMEIKELRDQLKEVLAKVDQRRGFRMDILDFDGGINPENFIEWLKRVERVFNYKDYDDHKRFKVARSKLKGYANLWYENLKSKRRKEGKARIDSWETLKVRMKKRFSPTGFEQDIFLNLKSLKHDAISHEEYTIGFDEEKLNAQNVVEYRTEITPKFDNSTPSTMEDKEIYVDCKGEIQINKEEEQAQHEQDHDSEIEALTTIQEPKETVFLNEKHIEKDLEQDDHGSLSITLTLPSQDFFNPFEIDRDTNGVGAVLVQEKRHIDFLGIDGMLRTTTTSTKNFLFKFLPKVFCMGLKFDVLKFCAESTHCLLILKFYKTRGRVFFKGEENDAEYDIKIFICIYCSIEDNCFRRRGV